MAKKFLVSRPATNLEVGKEYTEEELKAANHDLKRLTDLHVIDPNAARDAEDDTPRQVTDEANKLNVEQAIREETGRRGRPLDIHEQDELAIKVTQGNAKKTATAEKADRKEQQDANVQRQKDAAAAERRDAGRGGR